MMARGTDSSGNWIHLAPPSENFDAGNMTLTISGNNSYKVLMRDTTQQSDLYPVDTAAS
jgi:hypothetical protein